MIKKLFYTLLFILIGFVASAQTYPTPYQVVGTSPNSAAKVKGGFFIDSTIVIPHYEDTAIATASYTGSYNSLIQVGVNNIYYKRVGNKWVAIEANGGCPQGLISGSATWSSFGLIYNVTDCQYAINCNYYSSPATNITLSPADPSYPRFDVIYVDTNNVAGVLTGTPSTAPIKPTIDPLSQLELTYVYVPASGTTPGGETSTIVYDENVEWGGASTVPSANFAFLINPYTGIYSTYLPSPDNGGVVTYTDTVTHILNDYQYLKFWIRANGAYAEESVLYASVVFQNGNVRVSPTTYVNDGTYGFDGTLTNQWQLVTIPIPQDLPSVFDRVRITVYNRPSSYQIDRVFLLAGANPPAPSGNFWGFYGDVDVADNKFIGKLDSTDFRIKTNGQTRVIVPADGIKENNTNDVKMVMIDQTTGKLYWQNKDSIGVLGCLKLYDSAGVKWIRDTCSYSGSQWLLTGNAGTTPGTNFIGTTDDKDVVFKRNNLESGRIGAVTYYGALSGSLDLGVNNTFIGLAAGRNNNGSNNSGFGQGAMDGASGSYNTGVGFNSMLGNTGSFSTSAGFGAGVNNTGNYLTAIGYLAAHQNTSKYVTAIGDSAAYANPYRSIIALGRKASANANYQFAIYDSITHFRIPGYLPASFDTAANKPMVFNPTTKVAQYLDHWPGAAAATTPGLNAVLGVDSVAYHNIFLKGSKSFSTMSDGLGFGEATLYHTEGTGGQLYLTRSSGYGANLMPVSGATTVSTHFLPDTTGTYLLYVNGVAPNSKGKLRLSSFPDSIVTPLIKSTGGGALTVKVGSNTPMIFNSDGTISVSGAISSSSTFTGTVIASSTVLRTSGFLDFGGGTSRLSAGSADGNMKITNSGGTDFGMMQYGGTSSSYPAIKRSGTKIQIRLADDSNFGTVEASNIRSGTGSPESAITAPVGTIYARTDGGTTDAAYLKTSGTGNTGWERMGVKKFKEYVAILNQSSTSAPTATVISNELGGTVTLNYASTGIYTATLTGAFTTNKTIVSITLGKPSESASLFGYSSDPDTIKFGSYDSSGSAKDGLISNSTFIIRVYY